jgi:hypothetical protein
LANSFCQEFIESHIGSILAFLTALSAMSFRGLSTAAFICHQITQLNLISIDAIIRIKNAVNIINKKSHINQRLKLFSFANTDHCIVVFHRAQALIVEFQSEYSNCTQFKSNV